MTADNSVRELIGWTCAVKLADDSLQLLNVYAFDADMFKVCDRGNTQMPCWVPAAALFSITRLEPAPPFTTADEAAMRAALMHAAKGRQT